jgi:hypothetical protein
MTLKGDLRSEKRLLASSCLSVRLSVPPHGTTRFTLDDFYNIWHLSIFLQNVEKIQVSLISDKDSRYLLDQQYAFMISRSVLPRIRNISDNFVDKNQNTHFLFNNFFRDPAVYEVWKNTVQPDRPHMTIWRMRVACWIPKATNTHSEYLILIAFPLQQWLNARATKLRYTYIASHVALYFF